MNSFKVGDFIVTQEVGRPGAVGQPSFGIVQWWGDPSLKTNSGDTICVLYPERHAYPSGKAYTFVGDCQHYQEWLDEQL